MDRLSLYKVLADPSRYAIYQELAGSDEPLSTVEVAERLELHPNTVRIHLEKMRDAGLVDSCADRHGSVGRPQYVWSASDSAPSLGLEPSGFRVLAHLLAEVAAGSGSVAERTTAAGRRRGEERTSRRPVRVASRPDQSRSERLRLACVKAVADELADLGFDPAVEPDGAVTRLSFTKCPFRELAVLYPDLVCELHRGLTEGILAGVIAANPGVRGRLESFSSLVEPDPCRAAVSVRA